MPCPDGQGRVGALLIFWRAGEWSGWRGSDLVSFAPGRSLDYFRGLFFWFFLFAAACVSISHVQ
jgi:hypothetical protein